MVYMCFYFEIVKLPEPMHAQILPVLPFWVLVALGAYALASLGWGVFTFQDKEQAYQQLLGEIQEAKKELKAKGVSIDS